MEDKNYLKVAQEKLSSAKLSECLNILKDNIKDKDILNQIYQLEIRYNSLNRKINNGTIDLNDSQLEENRISNSILLIITNLSTGNVIIDPKSKENKFDPKWLIIGFLILALSALGYYISTLNNDADPCAKIECLNNGTCIDGTCNCPSGYTGDRCQTKIQVSDACINILCLNGGICRDGTCECPSGYTGDRCEKKIQVSDPCRGITCQNNGVCRDGKCDCPSGYTGKRCETKISADPCKGIVCLNRGKCSNGKCKCPSGYTGDRCQTKIIDEGTREYRDPRTNQTFIVDSRDKSKYNFKKIGSKFWMTDNINYKITGSKCNNCNKKGRHYDLSMAKKVCPDGWTLPSVKDFTELVKVGGSFEKAVKLAEIEFNGRYGRVSGGNDYNGIGTFAAYWTSSSDGRNGNHYFFNKSANISRADVQGNDQMYSCRCIKKD